MQREERKKTKKAVIKERRATFGACIAVAICTSTTLSIIDMLLIEDYTNVLRNMLVLVGSLVISRLLQLNADEEK